MFSENDPDKAISQFDFIDLFWSKAKDFIKLFRSVFITWAFEFWLTFEYYFDVLKSTLFMSWSLWLLLTS